MRVLSVLLLALVAMSVTAKEYMPSYFEVTKRSVMKTGNGKATVKGNILDAYSEKPDIYGDIHVAYGETVMTVKTSFELEIDPADTVQITLSSSSYDYEPLTIRLYDVKANEAIQLDAYLVMYMVEAEKPIIYLYSDKSISFNVKLDIKGDLKFSYPTYKDGWNVTIEEDGSLSCDGKSYAYLFWDASYKQSDLVAKADEWIVVEKVKVTEFLENYLTNAGFNDREIADFVTYWAPRMMHDNYYRILFLEGAEYDRVAPLSTSVKPDQTIRLYMVFQGWQSAKPTDLSKLKQTKVKRLDKGFRYVEWGGSELK